MCPKNRGVALLLFALAWLAPAGSGCNHLVKNDRHQVTSKARYGTDRFVTVDGYTIHYVEMGEGPPLLLIPGAFSTYRVWNRMIPDLSVHYRVLAMDYLGMGDSDKPESGFGYTIEEQADLVAKTIAALKLSRVSVAGASYGSAIALTVAARHPELVDRVACIEGGALIVPETLNYSSMYVFFKWPFFGDILMEILKTGLFDETAARTVMGSAWERMSPEDRKEIVEIASYNIKTASRFSWYRIYRTIDSLTDLTGSTKSSRVPILYLYGGESKYREVAEANVEFLRDHVPNSAVVWMKDGIHDLQMQFPGKTAAILHGFLEEGRAAKGLPPYTKNTDADRATDVGPDGLQ